MDLAVQAVQRGIRDAGAEAAARTWMAAGRFVSRFVYTTCYTISYGVVFPSVLLARSIPGDNAAARGLIDGADARGKRSMRCLARPSSRRPAPSRRSLAGLRPRHLLRSQPAPRTSLQPG